MVNEFNGSAFAKCSIPKTFFLLNEQKMLLFILLYLAYHPSYNTPVSYNTWIKLPLVRGWRGWFGEIDLSFSLFEARSIRLRPGMFSKPIEKQFPQTKWSIIRCHYWYPKWLISRVLSQFEWLIPKRSTFRDCFENEVFQHLLEMRRKMILQLLLASWLN